jgi:lysophosphatidylcholine acyltransferase/lyso-PAF acetyltransferase
VFAGLFWVKIKGTRAKAKEAPILVVVPHTSVIDAFPLMLMGIPTVVAKAEVHKTPIMGKLLDLTQPIYVRRDSASSRHNALKEIARRSHSIENWPQIAIFPEGTTTNYTGLAKFKIGAFYPGVPVQPVIVRWPNRCDTTTWAFDGTPAWKLLFLMFCQFMTHLELEYLPVYYPSEDEQNDPNVYASNVQSYLAGVLKIPATDYEYKHGVQLLEMRNSQLPNFLLKVRKLHKKLQAQMKTTEIEIVREALKKDMKWTANSKEVTALFRLNTETKAVKKLITLYDRSKTGTIDLREYLTHVFLLNSAISRDRIPMIIFMLYGENKIIECKSLITVLQNLFFIPEGRAEVMIEKATSENLERIDMACFERIMGKRLDFIKLFAMETCGEL